ncbi:MAG: sigma 54-interacting transcriptional regulator [Candidatus Caldatribacteriota bacterium]|jgi:PAS domain S-box-containing protein|nr:sigma 54-interacting transcriptional regulator [Atribacterota bacterium]MDD3030889.1 sigma 54-interacting transcriptional regulator [Atribacterota bacterium]MDD4288448.1 sigma 54-interacting transcriptional regulator [Atribacterota bacterium]MDD4764347.1 sigma 54-interacting transcriptional regulator [Atribacterota bacterium]MDD5634977.1 sigma 54-interacting transcriptional regulator [Atribacterota bacterium]
MIKQNKSMNKELLYVIKKQKEILSTLKAIINSTDDAISVVNEKGVHTLVNDAYTRLIGLTEQDVLGKSSTIDIAEGESMHMKVLKTKKPVHGVRMKVGPKKKDVLVNVAPVTVDGELRGSVAVIHDLSEIRNLTDELNQVKKRMRHLEAKYTFEDIVGKSRPMIIAKEQAIKAASTPATVLLHGESGTGKELFAHAIHNHSDRKNRQFIRVNCSALTETLLESELFGYEGGAFTGASKKGRKGLFEEADRGTIFLDEIGMMSMNLQAKLLRVLQEKEIVRVGGNESIDIDVRVISATNINLENAVKDGRFREDLYYRLYVIPIFIPPLRDRKEDIKPLVSNIIRKCNQEFGRNIKGASPEVIEILLNYSWPGNIRELENVIERAVINMKLTDDFMNASHIPEFVSLTKQKVFKDEKEYQKENIINTKEENIKCLKNIKKQTEKDAILNTLKAFNGDCKKSAEQLGISIRTLYYKMQKYEIKKLYDFYSD